MMWHNILCISILINLVIQNLYFLFFFLFYSCKRGLLRFMYNKSDIIVSQYKNDVTPIITNHFNKLGKTL